MARIRRALVSVSDKRGVIELGRALAELGVEVLSTGGYMSAPSWSSARVIRFIAIVLLRGRVRRFRRRTF